MNALALHEVDVARRAAVAEDAISTSRRQWQREHRRPPALTAREALAALQFEALLAWTAAHNIVNGVELAEDDLDRLTVAMNRIDAIAGEVAS
jgi:hypothetical protein